MDKIQVKEAAMQWLEAWNQRKMETVMSHYADDVEFYSSAVIDRWQQEKGRLVGRAALERHFRKGMEVVPEMNFRFYSMLFGVDSVILLYYRETGILAADWVLFNEEGKVREVRSCYGEPIETRPSL